MSQIDQNWSYCSSFFSLFSSSPFFDKDTRSNINGTCQKRDRAIVKDLTLILCFQLLFCVYVLGLNWLSTLCAIWLYPRDIDPISLAKEREVVVITPFSNVILYKARKTTLTMDYCDIMMYNTWSLWKIYEWNFVFSLSTNPIILYTKPCTFFKLCYKCQA